MKLYVLNEGAREEAAIDLIRKTIAGTPFDRRVWIAGGFVRDEILGMPSKDIDLVIDADDGGIKFAEWICRKLGIYKEGSNPLIYPKYGTAMFTFKHVGHLGQDLSNVDIECVMPRKDIGATGPSRKDVITAQGTMRDDAERRDLTINAMYKNVTTGQILDPTGMGQKDLKDQRLRTPGDPDLCYDIPEKGGDPLRMLRAIRFFSKFGYEIDPSIIQAIQNNLGNMVNVSADRKRDELVKMMVSDRPVEAIELLVKTGLIDYIAPELKDLIGLEQGIYHSKDAFGHTMDVLAKTPPRLIPRLAALLHDIGKAAARQPHPRKGFEFLEHEKIGAEIARKILKSLHFDNEVVKGVCTLVGRHMALRAARQGTGEEGMPASDRTLRRFRRKVGDDPTRLADALELLKADYEAHPGADPTLFDKIKTRYKELEEIEKSAPAKPVVTGRDIMQEFGIGPGPAVGTMTKYVRELLDVDPHMDKETILIKLREKFDPNEEE
jgi:poly(A) polymerase